MTSTTFDPETTTVARARAILRKRLSKGEATKCPCCSRTANMRRGSITPSMARALVGIYRASPREPFSCRAPFVRDRNGDYAKLRHWGLLRPAGRAGWWRLTRLGRAFVRGLAEVPATALTYNRKLVALVGEPVSIRDCLAKRSADFDEMRASTKGGKTDDPDGAPM